MERSGIEDKKIKSKVAYALKNADKLSQEELELVWNEAMEFIKTLPEDRQGAFYWNSGGLESLFMLVSASDKEL